MDVDKGFGLLWPGRQFFHYNQGWSPFMAGGRVLFTSLSYSRRFNRLCNYGFSGNFAQLIYLMSYPHVDSWGHVPLDAQTIKYTVIPGFPQDLNQVLFSLCLLVHVKLWDKPYETGTGIYCHIFNFEEKCRDGIRLRKCGVWPDESGQIPRRDKDEKLEVSLERAASIRKNPTRYCNLNTHPVLSPVFREIRELECNLPIPVVPVNITGELCKKPDVLFSDLVINGQKLRSSYVSKLYHVLRDDLETLGRVFFRARNAEDVYGFVQAGIADGWILRATPDEESAPELVRSWIDDLFGIRPPPPTKGNTPGSIMGGIFCE